MSKYLVYQNTILCDSAISDHELLCKDRRDEWTVKIYCDHNLLHEQIDTISPDAALLEEMIMASPPGKAYLLQRKKTLLVSSEIERICDEFIGSCFNKFKSFSYSVFLHKMETHGDLAKSSTIILNASFLVAPDKLTDFLNTSELIRKDESNPWFSIETRKS